jgi:hypothetical protein
MPEWLSEIVNLAQLILNGVVLVGGAAIWKLYVANLKAAVQAKEATIETVEQSRDLWKEKAQELRKQSPEVVEKALAERIHIRDGEIARLKADKVFDESAVRSLEINKAELEHNLFRTQGFRAMLALEEQDDDSEPLPEVDARVESASRPSKVEVAFIGEVAVDSGQLLVTDPCYIDSDWQLESYSALEKVERSEDTLFNYSYDGACRATLNGEGHGQLRFELGHAGAGIAFSTAWGDGMYPVYAEKHDGRIVRVYINVG